MASLDWPVVHHYDATHLDRISLPIGGIGTGTIGLGGRGDLRDFEVGNRPGKGFRPEWAFFAIRAETAGRPPVALAVEGPVPIERYEGAFGSPAAHHGLPRFASCDFDAGYPFGRVRLRDETFPVAVDLLGFNPFVLTDVAASSIPVVILRHRLTNLAEAPTTVSVALSMSNFVGANGTADETGDNRNTRRDADGIHGVTLSAPGLPAEAEAGGELTMAVLAPPGTTVSHRTGWDDRRWGNPILDFWDDLLDDGRLEDRPTSAARPIASLAGTVTLAPGQSAEMTFLLTWSFPHRRAWRSEDHGGINVGEYSDAVVGNAYSVAYPDSWRTAIDLVDRLDDLEQATVDSLRAVAECRRSSRGRRSGAVQPQHPAEPHRLPDRRRRVLRLGGCRRPHRQLLRHLHPRVGVRVRDVAVVRPDRPVVPPDPVRSLHRRRRADELPGGSAGRRALPDLGPGRGGRADGLSRPSVSRLEARRRRRLPGRPVAGRPSGARVLLDPGRLGRRPGRRDGGRPAQHHGRRVLRAQSADGFVVPGRAAGLRRDGRVPGRSRLRGLLPAAVHERVAMARRRAVQR